MENINVMFFCSNIHSQRKAPYMYICVIFLKFSSIIGMSFLKNKFNYQSFKDEDEYGNKIYTKTPKFRLNSGEMQKFFIAFNTVHSKNKQLMEFARSMKKSICDEYLLANFLSELKSYIRTCEQVRLNSRDQYACEYEYFKLSEFLYHVFDFIVKLDQKSALIIFVEFFYNRILKILDEMSFDLFTFLKQSDKKRKNDESKSNKNQISEEMRHELLCNFCEGCLLQGKTNSIDHIKEDHKTDDLLFLCSNIFTALMCTRNKKFNAENFIISRHLRRSISEQFRLFIYMNAKMVNYMSLIRILMKKFLCANHFDLEKALIEQGKIPAMFDAVNESIIEVGCDKIMLNMDHDNDLFLFI